MRNTRSSPHVRGGSPSGFRCTRTVHLVGLQENRSRHGDRVLAGRPEGSRSETRQGTSQHALRSDVLEKELGEMDGAIRHEHSPTRQWPRLLPARRDRRMHLGTHRHSAKLGSNEVGSSENIMSDKCLIHNQIEQPQSLRGKCCCICALHAPVKRMSKEEELVGWACLAPAATDRRFDSPVFFSETEHGICELFLDKNVKRIMDR